MAWAGRPRLFRPSVPCGPIECCGVEHPIQRNLRRKPTRSQKKPQSSFAAHQSNAAASNNPIQAEQSPGEASGKVHARVRSVGV
jgi:hypothetical protein